VSRFLDQIRKAKEAREQLANPSGVPESEILMPGEEAASSAEGGGGAPVAPPAPVAGAGGEPLYPPEWVQAGAASSVLEQKSPEGAGESDLLYPSDLMDKKASWSGPAYERLPEVDSSEDSIPAFNLSSARRPSGSVGGGRRTLRRRGSRREIPIPGPERDPEAVSRIAQVALRPDPRILSFYDPQDHVCEEYRLLGKNILHTFATTPDVDMTLGKVVALSSSARGEGKTLTSVNLAMTMAQDLCDRVILLDVDLRHPKVHRYLGVAGSSNLNDLLAAEDPNAILEDCIVRTESGLHLLMSAPCGRNPAQLIDSDNMTRLLEILRKRYSLIVLDTPPVLLATDALTVGTRSDGMLFLLRARKTQREQIQEARQRIARLEIRMLGYVINNVRSFLPQIWRKYYYGNY
jgi:capsular exopolysaccharide synthesis family protein